MGWNALIVVPAITVLTAWSSVALAARAATAPTPLSVPTAEAFIEAGCNRCHAVESEEIAATTTSDRMRGPDLSRIGDDRDAEWLARYLKKEETIEGTAHRPTFRGTDDELAAIAAWLADRKAP